MNVLLGLLIVAVVTAVAVTAMLLVRRRAPDGGYFNDGDRAAGVFGVLATGFSVLIGFIVFLAFSSYDQSRVGAENEAIIVAQQIQTAQLLPPDVRAELTGELVCYARSVVGPQWEKMESGTLGDQVNPWGAELFVTIQGVEPETASEQSAYDAWLSQTSDRQQARSDRIHGAVGVIPATLWVVIFFVSAVIFVFMLFFADRGERAIVQAVLMGSVVAVITAMLLLLSFLNDPYRPGLGSLRPVAMERALRIIDQELEIADRTEALPCDERGVER